MNKKQWKKLYNALLKKGLRYTPKAAEEKKNIGNSWYLIMKNYSQQEVQNVLYELWLSKNEFPTLSEILEKIQTNRLGITDVRSCLYKYQQEKEKISSEYREKIKDTTEGKRELVKERNKKINNLIPEQVRKLIDVYGGDVEEIIKYKLKEFKASLQKRIKKQITDNNRKLLEE